jgi:hypothetical protein
MSDLQPEQRVPCKGHVLPFLSRCLGNVQPRAQSLLRAVPERVQRLESDTDGGRRTWPAEGVRHPYAMAPQQTSTTRGAATAAGSVPRSQQLSLSSASPHHPIPPLQDPATYVLVFLVGSPHLTLGEFQYQPPTAIS